MPFIPTLRRQRQGDLYELEANLVYRASSRPVLQRNSVSKKQKESKQQKMTPPKNFQEKFRSHALEGASRNG